MLESIQDLAVRNYWNEWVQISCPTLLIVGKATGSISHAIWDEMIHAKLEVHLEKLENAGHDVHLEQPEIVGKAVLGFLSGLKPYSHGLFDSCVAIRPINESDSIKDLTQLLHWAYAPLADVGLNYSASDQSSDVTRRRVEKGECYIAIVDGTIVGTVTLYKPDKRTRCDWYNRPDTAHFGQFAVEPAQQGKGIGSRLLTHIEGRARMLGFSQLALDTAEGASELVRFYLARGYRIVDRVRWDGKTYQSLVMNKALGASPKATC